MPDTDFTQPWSVTDLDLVFPATALERMPAMEDIPEEFKRDRSRWEALFWTHAMFGGIEDIHLIPVKGVDPEAAWRHLNSITGSYAPKHEHKEAALAYLTSLWFKAATWKALGKMYQSDPNDQWPTGTA